MPGCESRAGHRRSDVGLGEVNTQDLFDRDVARPIPWISRVDDEENLAGEIDEFIVTDAVGHQLKNIFDDYERSISGSSENSLVWVTGAFGSGKSSFAKMVGYIVENPLVGGRSVVERFSERIDQDGLEILRSIHARGPSLSVYLHLPTSLNIASEDEIIVFPLYRALLRKLGYARNILLAELELTLEAEGNLQAFEIAFKEHSTSGRTWDERRHVGLAKLEAGSTLHLLWPDRYPTDDAWLTQVNAPEVSYRWFAERAATLLTRRGFGATRLNFIVDEVGSYLGRSTERLSDLLSCTEAFVRSRGTLWMIATSQSTKMIGEHEDQLFNISERFSTQVSLTGANTVEVICERLLKKSPDGARLLQKMMSSHTDEIRSHLALDSPRRGGWTSARELVRTYPFFPCHLPLILEAVDLRCATNPEVVVSFHRTTIQIVQRLLTNWQMGVEGNQIGEFVTFDRVYDLIGSIVPILWRGAIESIETFYGRATLETRICKVLAVCADIASLPLNTRNLAALLHPALGAKSLRAEVNQAVERLVSDGRIVSTSHGYEVVPSDI